MAGLYHRELGKKFPAQEIPGSFLSLSAMPLAFSPAAPFRSAPLAVRSGGSAADPKAAKMPPVPSGVPSCNRFHIRVRSAPSWSAVPRRRRRRIPSGVAAPYRPALVWFRANRFFSLCLFLSKARSTFLTPSTDSAAGGPGIRA